eukprot:GHVR01026284.1.p1 GENE.GHVR01026284.1~~GHVR01026284.1.p1  ORF type:complete len:168 (+),score=25.09 GHVR01026284.1:214-717(+)
MMENFTIADLKAAEKKPSIWRRMLGWLPWLVFVAIGLMVVNNGKIPGVEYSARNWIDTMSTDEYVEEFENNDITAQFAPRTVTTVDGAPLDQLYNCYEYLGGYTDPTLQPIFEQLGQPIIWTGDTLPALNAFGTYDLTGKQLRLYVNGSDVFAGFQCPANAHLMRGE